MSTTSTHDTRPDSAPASLPVRPRRRPGQHLATGLVGVLVALVVLSVARNPNFEWGVVGEYLFDPRVLDGLWLTIWLTVVCQVIGIVLGVVLALMSQSDVRLVSGVSAAYVWLFRGVPLIVQIFIWFNVAALYPDVEIGLPFLPPLATMDANELITPLTAAILALGLNEAAYMSEVVRAGLMSVDDGQVEAAQSLGMSRNRLMRRIVLPQAMRIIIPPTGNQTITMLKTTALASLVAVSDLLYSVQVIYTQTFQPIPLLLVASFWYLVLVSVLTLGQRRLEAYFDRGYDSRPTQEDDR